MRVAVTGASGFVGGWIARMLTQDGHEVHTFGRRPERALAVPLPRYTQWDLTSGPMATSEVDAVVHSAAHVDDWGPSARYYDTNVTGMHNTLASFPGIKRFIHISTASVYAPATEPLIESAPLDTSNPHPYINSKVQSERVIAASGRDVVVLRPHIVYGPADPTLMPRVLAARRLGRLFVPGDGHNHISVTHVFNLVHAVQAVLRATIVSGVYNIVDLECATIDSLLRTMLRRHGVSDDIVYIPLAIARPLTFVVESTARLFGAARSPPLSRFIVDQLTGEHRLDATKACNELGYAPRWTYRTGPVREEDM